MSELRKSMPNDTDPDHPNHSSQEKNMTSADELRDQIDEAWDHGGPLCRELKQRLTDQFAQQLLDEDAMPRCYGSVGTGRLVWGVL
jgi:hypothetical protein